MKRNLEKTPGFDDVIFRDRNREYGAYELRKRYGSTMSISVVAGLIFGISIVLVPFFSADRGGNIPGQVINITAISDPSLLDPPTPEPPSTPPPPESIISQSKFAPPVVVADNSMPVDAMLTTDEQFQAADDGDPDEIKVMQSDPEPVTPPEVKPYIFVQEMPSFPGGEGALLKFIVDNIHYPSDALENHIEGTVILQFVVTATGEVNRVVILRGADPLLDNEAVRVISILPRWKPGKQDGNPVPVYFSVPVIFRIN